MKETKDITVCVFDHSLFLPIAQRMAHGVKRVLYHCPSEEAFRTLNKSIYGDGYADIEMVDADEMWSLKDEIDLFMFPDSQGAGLQGDLESQGKLVWGSRGANHIEHKRDLFLKVLGKVGFPVPKQTTIKGVTKLGEYLADKDDKYIKISKYRGSLETYHWRSWDFDEGWLDALAVKFGPYKEKVPFMVFEPIDVVLENGADTYGVDGLWPSLMLNGSEYKDKSYLGAVTKFDDMPDNVKDVLEAFSGVLADYRFRNMWSMEMRGDFFTDPTPRGGLPSTGSQLNLWSNFPDIVYYGAQGVLIEPEPVKQFSCECILTLKCPKGEWGKTRIPKELVPWAKFSGCCQIDGAICFPPTEQHGDEVGWLTSIGDTAQEAIESMHDHVKLLPDGLSAATDSLFDLLNSIKEGEKDGIQFSNEPVPDPLIAIET